MRAFDRLDEWEAGSSSGLLRDRIDGMSQNKVDFFISYASTDKPWAEWIGWTLEERGYSVRLQAWDFAAGSNFVLEMQRAAEEASKTIAVLSPAYLKSAFAAPEWAARFAEDPKSSERSLLPVRVRECEARGLLKAVVHIDLVGLEETEARQQLLDGLRGRRGKPSKKPLFPGGGQTEHLKAHPTFPGPGSSVVGEKEPTRHMPKIRRSPTDLEKRRFLQSAFDAIVRHFDSALTELAALNSAVEYDLKEISATKYVAEIFINGDRRAHCKFWMGDGMGGDGIKYSETDFGWDSDNSFNELLSLRDDALALQALMKGFGGEAEKGLNLECLKPEEAAEYLWRQFTWRLG